jgi:hypothetical protein
MALEFGALDRASASLLIRKRGGVPVNPFEVWFRMPKHFKTDHSQSDDDEAEDGP